MLPCRALADTRQIGKLTREQFALAMHLIQQKVIKGVDPPQSLTADMIPPTERGTPITVGPPGIFIIGCDAFLMTSSSCRHPTTSHYVAAGSGEPKGSQRRSVLVRQQRFPELAACFTGAVEPTNVQYSSLCCSVCICAEPSGPPYVHHLCCARQAEFKRMR